MHDLKDLADCSSVSPLKLLITAPAALRKIGSTLRVFPCHYKMFFPSKKRGRAFILSVKPLAVPVRPPAELTLLH